MPTITPFLWFDGQAEAAAAYYVSVFPNSALRHVSRYSEAGPEQHGQTPGTAMTVAFEHEGQPFTALNGGPDVQFSPAVSFVVNCKRRPRSIITGRSSVPAARPRRSNAAGSPINSVCRGRSCRTV